MWVSRLECTFLIAGPVYLGVQWLGLGPAESRVSYGFLVWVKAQGLGLAYIVFPSHEQDLDQKWTAGIWISTHTWNGRVTGTDLLCHNSGSRVFPHFLVAWVKTWANVTEGFETGFDRPVLKINLFSLTLCVCVHNSYVRTTCIIPSLIHPFKYQNVLRKISEKISLT